MSSTTIDDVLKAQLAQADTDEDVGAVFTLRSPSDELLSAEETEQLVKRLCGDAERRTDAKPSHVSVFPNIQSFSVAAPAPFIESLMASKEIESATANVQNEELLIRPVKVDSTKASKKSPTKRAR